MFSGAAFSEFACSEHEHEALDSSAFEAFLAEVTARRVWIVELEALSLGPTDLIAGTFSGSAFSELATSADAGTSAGGPTVFTFGTEGYTSHPTDTPASTYYEARIQGLPLVDRQIIGKDGVGGLASCYAEITLDNSDGALDVLLDDYAFDGRRVQILVGRPGQARAEFGVVFTGVAQTPKASLKTIQWRFSDGLAKLERLIQETTYAGTGGLEGGEDLKGKRKPLAYGPCANVQAPEVDSTKLIHQVHDGAVNDISAVYDRGVSLTRGADYTSQSQLETVAPSAGQYRAWLAGGYFRLGATAAGTVTADLEGDASLSGYIEKRGAIIQRILAVNAELNSSEVHPLSFLELNEDAPEPVNLWIGTEPRTIGSVVDELLGYKGWGGFSRFGTFTVGVVAKPEGEPFEDSFVRADITSLMREPLPAPLDPAVWRVQICWGRNYTVQTDLAASVSAARRDFAVREFRIAERENLPLKSQRLLARELGPLPEPFAEEADADGEAERQLSLWSEGRAPYRLGTKIRGMLRDIGHVIEITHPRQGFQHGVPARVLGTTIRGLDVELRVLA